MCSHLTEEEMRQALFGHTGAVTSPTPLGAEDESPVVLSSPLNAVTKRKTLRPNTPRLVVTLRVGNEFEGKTELFILEVHTLSTLQAELDAMKAARKKFKYVDLISIKPSS